MEEREQTDLEAKRLSIFTFSPEDDNFIVNLSSSPLQSIGLQQSEYQKESISLELFETMDGQEGKDICHRNEEDDNFPELCESMQPERTKWKRNPKSRNSLAWNSAFFTDAGVLDPEELSSMIKGTEKCEVLDPEELSSMITGTEKGEVLDLDEFSSMIKETEQGEKHLLSGNNEDVEQSIDSISTFESDDLILEQLEAEVFEDIRASIVRSSKVLNVMISSCKSASPKAVDEATSALKKADCTSKNVLVPKVAPKRTIKAQTYGMPKSQQKQTGGVQSSGKMVTKENSQVTQAMTRTLDSKSFLARPRKLSSKVNSVSAAIAKGTSMGANHVKSDHVNAKISTVTVAGKEARVSKFSAANNAHKVAVASRSSSDSTASTSSDKTGKSTFPATRRKVESRPVDQSSSGSSIKTTSKIALKNEISSRNSAVGAYVMSSKMSPGFSPASSISEWSSTSSSSSSINKRSNASRTSLDTSRSMDSDNPSLDLTNSSSHYQTSDKSVPKTTLFNENIRKPSRLNGTLSQPSYMKPSGLRMPSPKIGFFDRVKPGCTPNRSMQSHSNGSAALTAKIGANVRTNIKPKIAKLPPAKTLKRAEGDTETVPSHASLKDKLPAPVNMSGSPGDIEYYSSPSQEVHHERSGGCNLHPKDVAVEGHEITKHVEDAGLIPVDHGDQGLMKSEMSRDIYLKPDLNDTKIIAVEGERCDSVSKNTETVRSEVAPSTPFGGKTCGSR
ncbi:PREDICTED: probable serine/threonine-protein kinase dyrk2 [Ipomoea nil]|uniref:probable serine/threonine-protein kinase dyrk2 n=1 Tax=Ipomoea nil TaxID=35883 RepID=UPI000901775E|nr:PREDICTED: probable serine/threonine-protein kinase dyrk2 [Ipomoea nil]